MISKAIGAAAAATALYALGSALAQRKRYWSISYGMQGHTLELMEIPVWAMLVEDALAELPCTCQAPEWTYRAGPRWLGTYADGSNDPVYSLGSLSFQLCQLRNSLSWRFEKRVGRVALTREQARQVDLKWVEQCDSIFGDVAEDAVAD